MSWALQLWAPWSDSADRSSCCLRTQSANCTLAEPRYVMQVSAPSVRHLKTTTQNPVMSLGLYDRRTDGRTDTDSQRVMSLGRLRGTSASQQQRHGADDVTDNDDVTAEDDVTDDDADQLHQLIDQQVVVYWHQPRRSIISQRSSTIRDFRFENSLKFANFIKILKFVKIPKKFVWPFWGYGLIRLVVLVQNRD